MNDDSKIKGFAPIADAGAKIVILGSMPSIASLQKQQYYGHRRNAFWPIMLELFSGPGDADYRQRQQLLLANHVALWDVLHSCQRSGSLDSNIAEESIKTNDFIGFFKRHPAIKQVFFNGALAEKVYKKQVLPMLGEEFAYLQYRRLPSTSPAHAAMNLAQKCDAWRLILQFL
ncbi:DNA-deoxyinosine glycosylase [Methylomarinum vadi]|uniref:DNA-deoxyinosine glycosylase n=1 Tax=Methylomarinum vadi TaxID=438855 RepID=UPI0004DF9E83|nr:DNA-deoxyinosine glycosylase [Methylomarinum vadi]